MLPDPEEDVSLEKFDIETVWDAIGRRQFVTARTLLQTAGYELEDIGDLINEYAAEALNE